MKRFCVISLLSVVCFLSCSRESNEDHYLMARVISTKDISCAVPLLDFSEDAARIKDYTHQDYLTYGVVNLPATLNVQDKKLYVLIVNLPTDEEFACNTLGLAYPHLKIIAAKER